jgi:hypothetical protein
MRAEPQTDLAAQRLGRLERSTGGIELEGSMPQVRPDFSDCKHMHASIRRRRIEKLATIAVSCDNFPFEAKCDIKLSFCTIPTGLKTAKPAQAQLVNVMTPTRRLAGYNGWQFPLIDGNVGAMDCCC